MINIGVIGFGYWGPNIVRNFMANPATSVAAICDASQSRLAAAKGMCPGAKLTSDAAELINDAKVDAVAVVTPVESHFDLAMRALQVDKHVLIEKPITSTSAQALELIEESERRRLTLLVDHTFVYTSAVRKMREVIADPSFGKLQYYDSMRVNLGLFRHDVNVLWDLAVHDLSIMSYLIDLKPRLVSAIGCRHVDGQPENLAFLTVDYGDNVIAHVNANWLSPVKIRRTLVGGSKKMIVYDDIEMSEKVKIYDKGIDVVESPEDIRKLRIGYRTGDLWVPNLDAKEALAVEVEHFAKCIDGGEQPLTDGKMGLTVVRILEAADASLREQGRPVRLS